MIQINISNKVAYTLVAVLILITAGGIVYAYNSGGPPSVMGHSAEELMIDTDHDGTLDSTLQDAFDAGVLGGTAGVCEIYVAGPRNNIAPTCASGFSKKGAAFRDYAAGLWSNYYVVCVKYC